MNSSTSLRVNLGCGNQKLIGFKGVDKYPCEAVDILADITCTLPFEDDTVDEIYMDNVIEHINDIPSLLSEITRVCKKGAEITIITPHFACIDSWRDPTHVHHLSYFSMNHFDKESVKHYMGEGLTVVKRKLTFGGLMGNIGRILFLLNPWHYEKYWCFIFRPGTLTFVLKKN